MRLGLISQVRKMWCSIGTKIIQKIQISYKYLYLHLAVDGLNGTIHWEWAENMKQETVIKVVTAWQQVGIDAIIWDGAPSHRANKVQKLEPTLICQPPYAPELNPAERVFEAVRQEVERIIAGLVLHNDARRARFRGLDKTGFQAKMCAMAYNVKRWVSLLREKRLAKLPKNG